MGFAGGSVNLYPHSFNNPSNFRDPSGKIGELTIGGCVIGGLAGCAGGAVADFILDTLLVAGVLGFGAIAMGKGLPQSDPVSQTTPISTPADPNGRNISDSGNKNDPCSGSPPVIGHYPDYTNLARQLSARHFSIPSAEWNAMTEAEQWAANQAFLDEEIAAGNPFLLATPLDKVRPGSPLEREIH